jgi:cytochrome c oxidase cbb3-type subunit III
MRRTAILCLTLVLPLAAQHEKDGQKTKHPFLGDPAAIDAGHKLFSAGCAACHGGEGQGGRGPNLRERIYWHPVDEDNLFKVVKQGIPGGGMPGANLSDDQTWQVVAFVRSLTAPAIETNVPGDPSAGEQVFWGKGNCGNCHSIRGRGGKMGPDLSNAGGSRALPQMREDILDPDADGAVGYRPVTAVLTNGKTIKGVARNRTNYSIQIQEASGELRLVPVSDIRELTIGRGSPMPKDYATRLSKTELDNVLAYLARQSARPVEAGKK